jgi:3-deoxy-D-manno-octulosonic-acid transferase
MNRILYGAYALLGGGLFVSCFPLFYLYTRLSGRYGRDLKERLGCVPRELVDNLAGSPRIWLHAVSLGEIGVAASIVKALREVLPGCAILVSTTTEHGRDLALKTFEENIIPVVFSPIDFVGSVRKALARVRPDILVLLETEIWPAWLVEAHRMGIRTALINGRISVRSVGGYLRFRPFFREILKDVDAFSMITEEDAKRVRALGAPSEKIWAHGNAKYDSLRTVADPSTEKDVRRVLNLDDFSPVFVAGSTREGEEEMVLDAYEKILKTFQDMVLIIAPRHVERTGIVASLIAKRGLGYQRWSDLVADEARRKERVIIINAFGELFKIYSVGTIVFCGASLVPLGGQNPLEPAAWGKAVFYGPSMEDFLDAKAILEKAGSGIPVSGPDMLAEKACWFLSHPHLLTSLGKRAKQAVMANRDAAHKHARVVRKLVAR